MSIIDKTESLRGRLDAHREQIREQRLAIDHLIQLTDGLRGAHAALAETVREHDEKLRTPFTGHVDSLINALRAENADLKRRLLQWERISERDHGKPIAAFECVPNETPEPSDHPEDVVERIAAWLDGEADRFAVEEDGPTNTRDSIRTPSEVASRIAADIRAGRWRHG